MSSWIDGWEIASSDTADNANINLLLSVGWQPFSVDQDIIYFRRTLKAVKVECSGE